MEDERRRLEPYKAAWSETRSDEALAEYFEHAGYADGDNGVLLRYVSYEEADRIIRALAAPPGAK